jgi:thiol:disulfide interchange protein
MNHRAKIGLKIIFFLLIIGVVVYLISQFPDETFYIVAVALMILIFYWMFDLEKNES